MNKEDCIKGYVLETTPTGHISKLIPNEQGIAKAMNESRHKVKMDKPPYPMLGTYETRREYLKVHCDFDLPRWYSPAMALSVAKRRKCLVTRDVSQEDLDSEEFKRKAQDKAVYEAAKKRRFNKK